MPSASQDNAFAESVLNYSVSLDNAIDWIRDNLDPEDVFSTTQLEKWAESEGYVKKDDTE